jgi:hypothetical protein
MFNPQGVTETMFDVVNVENSVQTSLVSTLVTPGPDRRAARGADVLLPVDQVVRLMKDIPELALHAGDLGVVMSIWCAPIVAYEVEFDQPDEYYRTRVLLSPEHVHAEPADGSRDKTRDIAQATYGHIWSGY